MTQTIPYINFDGNCREAMTFYKECMGGDLNLQTIGGSPIEDQCPSGMKDQIMHGSLLNGGVSLLGSDMTGPEGLIKGNNITISLMCSTEEEINSHFSALAAGGQVQHPLAVMFWGGLFGTLTDKFGIRWMFNYDKNQQS